MAHPQTRSGLEGALTAVLNLGRINSVSTTLNGSLNAELGLTHSDQTLAVTVNLDSELFVNSYDVITATLNGSMTQFSVDGGEVDYLFALNVAKPGSSPDAKFRRVSFVGASEVVIPNVKFYPLFTIWVKNAGSETALFDNAGFDELMLNSGGEEYYTPTFTANYQNDIDTLTVTLPQASDGSITIGT